MSKVDIRRLLARQGILIAFAVFIIGFTLADKRFISPDNIMGVLRSSAILGVTALGVTFVVISGNLDLAFGSMMSFSTVVTLGMLSAIHGVTLTYSGGQNMDIADKEGTWFSIFGQSTALGVPIPILIFVALAALLGIVLAKPPFGRKVYAVGGNGTAAAISGIRRARGSCSCAT